MAEEKIVFLCGNSPSQIALACKINQKCRLVGIVAETNKSWITRKYSFLGFLKKAIEKVIFFKIDCAWYFMERYYKKLYPCFPDVDILEVENINNQKVFNFINEKKPSIIMVSGTSMIKGQLLNLCSSVKMLNLHTGLSPYVKGGPNCTNWCLSNDRFHLIGNTVMWIDGGIDTGNILTTDFVYFRGDEDLKAIHVKVMDEAHGLYMKAAETLIKNPQLCLSVKQGEIAQGETYYTKMWGWMQKLSLLYNMRGQRLLEIVRSGEFSRLRSEIKLVSLLREKPDQGFEKN